MPGRGALVMALVFALAIGWFLWGDRLVPPPPQSEVAITFRPCGTPGSGPCVIDGDTVAIGQRRVRLTGYDAPEMDGECPAESTEAREAKDGVGHLVHTLAPSRGRVRPRHAERHALVAIAAVNA